MNTRFMLQYYVPVLIVLWLIIKVCVYRMNHIHSCGSSTVVRRKRSVLYSKTDFLMMELHSTKHVEELL